MRDVAFMGSLQKTKPVPIGDVLDVFGDDAPDVFGVINNHQWARHVAEYFSQVTDQASRAPYATELMQHPLPKGLGELAALMTQNTISFDDPFEDVLAADPLIMDLTPRITGGTQELRLLAAQACRARRVVIATLAELQLSHDSQGLITQIQAFSKPPQ